MVRFNMFKYYVCTFVASENTFRSQSKQPHIVHHEAVLFLCNSENTIFYSVSFEFGQGARQFFQQSHQDAYQRYSIALAMPILTTACAN